MRSSTAVEQILGRIMRLHQAKRKRRVELNMAYAFSASKNFVEAANALEDALIQNGFNRQEAKELITRMPLSEQGELDLFFKVSEPLAEAPLLAGLPEPVAKKFSYDEQSKTCTFVGIMEEPEKYAILDCCTTPEARATIERLYRKSCGIPPEQPKTAAERGADFSVPLLSVQQGDLFEPFEESHFLEIPWRLSKYPLTYLFSLAALVCRSRDTKNF